MYGCVLVGTASRLSCLRAGSSVTGMKRAGGSRTSCSFLWLRSNSTAQPLQQRADNDQKTDLYGMMSNREWKIVPSSTTSVKTNETVVYVHSSQTEATILKGSQSDSFLCWFILRVAEFCNTHYLPSLVHPTLAMYSVPGNKELKGATSSLSCVLTICKYTYTCIRTHEIKIMLKNEDAKARRKKVKKRKWDTCSSLMICLDLCQFKCRLGIFATCK